MEQTEVWLPIKGYSLYQVSNYGRVKNIKTNRLLKIVRDNRGYGVVMLYESGIGKQYLLSRLVAQEFLPNDDNKPFVCHIDDNPMNNRVDNLFWGTPKENMQDCLKKGRYAINPLSKWLRVKKPVIAYSPDGQNHFFETVTEAAIKTGTYTANIVKAIQGKRKSAGGYVWKYATP